MALFNRGPIPPKKPKIRSSPARAQYKRNNPHCEVGLLVGRYNTTSQTQLHHILPGLNRDDVIWNMICLAPRIHDFATEHKNGAKARAFNDLLFAIKLRKNEITERKLIEIDRLDGVLAATDFLDRIDNSPFEYVLEIF